MAFQPIDLKPDALALGASACVRVGSTDVGLFRTNEGLFALNNLCPHRGAPLHDGFVTNGFVTCPWHQWQFELKDGNCRNIPGARVSAYALEVRDGTLWVDLESSL